MEGGNTPLPNTPQVQAMRKCGMTEDEILDVLRTDKEIDQGAKLFELAEELKAGAKKARRADRTFPPEFVNRLDDIIVFHPLNDEALAQILWLELRPLQARLEAMGYSLELRDETRQEILRLARDKQFGARPLKRAIQTLIEDPLTDKLLAGEIENTIIKI